MTMSSVGTFWGKFVFGVCSVVRCALWWCPSSRSGRRSSCSRGPLLSAVIIRSRSFFCSLSNMEQTDSELDTILVDESQLGRQSMTSALDTFGGRRPGPLVNPSAHSDGQYGHEDCFACRGNVVFNESMGFGAYLSKFGSPPVGQHATRPKPRSLCITHPEALCPTAHRVIYELAGDDSSRAWMLETRPRAPRASATA